VCDQRWRAPYGGANHSAASVYKSRRQPVGDRTARETSSRINPSIKLAPTPTPMRGLASESCSRGPARPTSVNPTTRAAGQRFASSSRARQNASPTRCRRSRARFPARPGTSSSGPARVHRLPCAQDVYLRDGIAAPVDPQRDLAAVQHAVAPQRPNPDADALPHPCPIGGDGPVDRFTACACRRDEPPCRGIEIGGAISDRRLEGEDGSNEESEAHVGLCTEPGEG